MVDGRVTLYFRYRTIRNVTSDPVNAYLNRAKTRFVRRFRLLITMIGGV